MCAAACYPGSFRCVADGSCVSSYYYCNRRCNCPLCTDELHCYTPPYYTTTAPPDLTITTSLSPPRYSTSSRNPFHLTYYTTTIRVDYTLMGSTISTAYPPYHTGYTTTTPRYPPLPPYYTTTSRYPRSESYFSMLPPYLLYHAINSLFSPYHNTYRPTAVS